MTIFRRSHTFSLVCSALDLIVRRKMKRCILVTAGIVLVGVLAAGFILWDTRFGAETRFSGRTHEPRIDSNFEKITGFIPSDKAEMTAFFFGLPHPYSEEEEFKHELWNSDNQSICGYRFYSEQSEPTTEITAEILRIFTSVDNFHPYGGQKLCGGYHADFAVKFVEDSKEYWFLVCMGCSEVVAYSDGNKLFFELGGEAYYPFRELWKNTYWVEQGVTSNADR